MIASPPRDTRSGFCASAARTRGKPGQECDRTCQIVRPLALLGVGDGVGVSVCGREGHHAEGGACGDW